MDLTGEVMGLNREGRVGGRKTEGLTAHGVQSHQAANEIVKVHVAVFITIATDNQLEEVLIQRETCTHTQTQLGLKVHTAKIFRASAFLTCSLEGFRQLLSADHT